MPEYLAPGVYIEERNIGPRPIEGVGTACAAFIGLAAAGPTNTSELITNWSQYVEMFGSVESNGRRNPHRTGAYLSYAVQGYLINGGGRCYVTNVASRTNGHHEEAPSVQLPSRGQNTLPSFTVTAKPGTAQEIEIEATASKSDPPVESAFNLRIKSGDKEENYENVTIGRGGTLAEAVATSTLIVVEEVQARGAMAVRLPELGRYVIRPRAAAGPPQLKAADFEGDVIERSGVQGLQIREDVTIVSCPDLMSAYIAGAIDKDGVKNVQNSMIEHCELMGDRVALIDPLPDQTPVEVRTWREKEANFSSKYAAMYYPWLTIMGQDGKPMPMPPSGHIAGIYARNDNERGVHKAPANEVVRGALGPVKAITKGEQETLNPIGINCIRSFTGRGVRVWGARTLSDDPAWRYVNVRRLFNFVEKSIEIGTQWVVFEPNNPDLWARIRRDISAFLTGLWREGMLFGNTPGEAFFVKCDEELNPEDVRDRGQLFIDIGLAPVKPAEFVVFRLSQFAGGGA